MKMLDKGARGEGEQCRKYRDKALKIQVLVTFTADVSALTS